MDSLGDWLKRLRAKKDLTQELLAEQACCAAQTIRMIETGRRRPSREMAERLADVLDVPDDERAEFLRVARAAPSAADVAPAAESRLPFAPNTLLGRDEELAGIVRAFTGADRIVSIVGPGGAGKTRLAIEAARELTANFADGVAWVDLTPLSAAGQVVPAISRAAGVTQSGAGSPLEILVEALRGRDLLLVLDNMEHLLGPESTAPGTVVELLSGAPRLRMLITSRVRPQLAGERTVVLAGLALPDGNEESAAIRLFAERAGQADHTFALSAWNRKTVAGICEAVGGMPLGIELAAAGISVLSPAEIAAELTRGLDVLAGQNRALPERQRGPRVVFEHSWRLLTPGEQDALRKLSVFRGGWSREAAGAVAGASLGILSSLVDKSLVRALRSDPETTRYAIHELVRQYAAEQLESDAALAAETRDSHAKFFTALLGRTMPLLQTAEQAAEIRRLEPDIANIRAAWEHAVTTRNVDLLGAMGYILTLVHEMRGTPREAVGLLQAGVACLREMLRRPDAPPQLRFLLGLLLTGYGWLEGRSGNVPAACDLLGEAVRILSANEDVLVSTPALGHYGLMLFQRGRLTEARAVLERGIAVLEPRQEHFFLTLTNVFLSFVAQEEGDLEESRALAERAMQYGRESGAPRARILSLIAGAISANVRGDSGTAMEFVQEGMALSIANRDRWGLAFILTQLGEAALRQGDLIEAGARLRESIDLLDEIGEPFNYCRALITLGAVEAADGNTAAAHDLWTDALRRARAWGIETMTKRAEAALRKESSPVT
jgi:predicted ATPase/DNA-binding XRE family transcriptional regulator